MGIIPLLTFYANHFIRIFALTLKNKNKIAKAFSNYGFIIHCSCGYRTTINDDILNLPKKCPSCGTSENLKFAGPLWLDKLHEHKFLREIIDLNDNSQYINKKRINKILNYALEELDMSISYYDIHQFSKKLKLKNVPKMDRIITAIQEQGYRASRTHFDFKSIKTDMELLKIKKLLLEL